MISLMQRNAGDKLNWPGGRKAAEVYPNNSSRAGAIDC